MADLLIEFFCEEIPARMQARAEADLARLLGDALKGAGLAWDTLEPFSGPRRLGLAVSGLPLKTEAVREELKGPRHNAPEQAIQGFLNKVTGNASPIELAAVAGLEVGQSLELNGFSYRVEDTGKGAVIFATRETPGRDTAQVLKTALPEIARTFPWPKSMKFGEGAKAQRWVRPLHSLICLLGGEVVPVEVFGLTASNITQGHRIHGSGPFAVTGYADYAQKLNANGVILTRAERRQTILDGARAVCAKAGLELIEDEGLLDEVTGLAEQPVAVMGDMDTGFLDLPPEVITLTMRTHQKYFAVRDPKSGALAPKFVTIANQIAPDGGTAIAAGNARVLSARLSDARHFWDLDRAKGLDAMAGELSKVTFHDKLGSVAERSRRLGGLSGYLASKFGANTDLAVDLGRICKADLVSQMVYEFPELQGTMVGYYWATQGGSEHTANALRQQYKPQGPSDTVPAGALAAALAVAEKFDTLVSFFSIDEKPTGSKDPFALRRAALGVIRILELNGYNLSLRHAIGFAETNLQRRCDTEDLLAFFADRLKVHLKDEGIRHDVIDAVFVLGDDDLVRVTNKSRALQAFLDAPDGAALLAGYRRAANILSAEEKKGFDLSAALAEVQGDDASSLLSRIAETASAPEELALVTAIGNAEAAAQAALTTENFSAAMSALAQLRGPVDAFFEAVVVNDKDPIVRRNRLVLLSRIRAAADAVADFSRLEG